ncbi:hypothetical protein [Rhizobium grahamii]|uniref:hypothetical protein n=1 Tax=Rhizobium grahamii TaxID=1120045 RepID=UPI001FCCBF7C|nr:hypothetical protein [Rhizobium grahamii]
MELLGRTDEAPSQKIGSGGFDGHRSGGLKGSIYAMHDGQADETPQTIKAYGNVGGANGACSTAQPHEDAGHRGKNQHEPVRRNPDGADLP